MDCITRDTGYNGQIVSLGGIIGKPGHGLVMRREGAQITFPATGYEVLGNNPARYWALVANTGADLTICFDSGSGFTTFFPFPAGAILQIDKQLPWTGPVFVTGAGSVSFFETSVQT